MILVLISNPKSPSLHFLYERTTLIITRQNKSPRLRYFWLPLISKQKNSKRDRMSQSLHVSYETNTLDKKNHCSYVYDY